MATISLCHCQTGESQDTTVHLRSGSTWGTYSCYLTAYCGDQRYQIFRYSASIRGKESSYNRPTVHSKARVITRVIVEKMLKERENLKNEKTRHTKVWVAKAQEKQQATSFTPTTLSPITPSPLIIPPTLETALPPPPITLSPLATPLPPKKHRQRKPKIKVEPEYEEGSSSQHIPIDMEHSGPAVAKKAAKVIISLLLYKSKASLSLY